MTPIANHVTSAEDLYIQYSSYVYRLAFMSTRNHTESEDIVQEVFLRILQKSGNFRGDSHVKTWISHIARNYIIDTGRKRRKEQRLLEHVSHSYSHSSIHSLIEIEDLLSVLPESQRRVIELRMIQDLSVAKAAELLDCSQAKVRTNTHRALQHIKQSVKEDPVV
ncbi:RNA polymerase sigma factor [Alicyclobacillus fodiniaquatilis]|uniref:RNA polymerase sigma factor n=1 Tax=Alicyclobacillus fodiniaquatilis TaxID=1661150 RepID=A0ABW4JD12_9BACL